MARLLAFIQFDHVTQNLFEHLIEILLHIILIMGGLLFLDTNETVFMYSTNTIHVALFKWV